MHKLLFFPVLFLFSNILLSQNSIQQGPGFKNYSVFTSTKQAIDPSLRAIATDIETLQVDENVLLEIQNEKPDFIQFQLVHAADTLMMKLQRQELFSDDFKIRNQNDEILEYNPGLYYRGKVNNDRNSFVVFNFFSENVNGVISIPRIGNRNIGQLDGSNQYVIYTDSKMSVSQDFECQIVEVGEKADLVPQVDTLTYTSESVKCVRVFYELTNDIYIENLASVDETMNWLTSVHNIKATLYSNASIPTALSDVLIWQMEDPYVGENIDKLEYFQQNRIAFNADIAHLLDLPVTGGVAYLDSLCQNFRYAFSGVSMSFEQLPIYSWTILVMSHEMGHSLGSPHTHACFWNGDSSPIDSCGPNNDYSEGCDDGPVPTNGGTIMSYCHLDDTGINLANGFHPQVAAYMSSNIDTKPCLGNDCIDSCVPSIAGVSVSETETNSITVTIDDVISNSWNYTIYELNTPPAGYTTITTNSFNYNTIQPNTYYVIQVLSICSNGNLGSFFNFLYLSDADWCSGVNFRDTGGLTGNYQDNETMEKTFYPDSTNEKITLTINEFDIEEDFDFMSIYDGDSTDAPVFLDGENLSGSDLTTTFFEATNEAGAITVKFTSDFFANLSGWDITVSCTTLSNQEFTESDFSVFPNPVNNVLNVTSVIPLDNVSIYDLHGRIVFQKKLNHELKTLVDLSQLNAGIYLLKVNTGSSTAIKRIIKK